MPARLALISLLVFAWAGCGSDAETEAAARAEARARSRATPASVEERADLEDAEEDIDPAEIEPSDEPGQTCRDGIGPAVAQAGGAGVLRLVAAHTVAAQTEALGDGCLVVLAREWTAAQLGPDEPFPYAYSYFLTNASGGRVVELTIDIAPPAARLAAVGLQDLNGDGETDILAVHDNGPALAWISAEPGRWTQDIPAPTTPGIDAQTIADARAIYRDLFADPVSP